MPVTIPAAGTSPPYRPKAASCENSRNGEPGSISAATRSRGSSLPRATWRSRATAPPPCETSATLARRSSTRPRIAAALAANSAERANDVGADGGHRGGRAASSAGQRTSRGSRQRISTRRKNEDHGGHGEALGRPPRALPPNDPASARRRAPHDHRASGIRFSVALWSSFFLRVKILRSSNPKPVQGPQVLHHAVSANNSRPISMRRISLVPAPISYSFASRNSRPVG